VLFSREKRGPIIIPMISYIWKSVQTIPDECRGVGWISSPFKKLGQQSVMLEDIVGADSDIG
jgi:hypothetical protein